MSIIIYTIYLEAKEQFFIFLTFQSKINIYDGEIYC